MSIIEELISTKIKKLDSTSNAQTYDNKMIQFACKDFTNYMKFKVKTDPKQCIEDQLKKIALEQNLELNSFLTVWTGMWIKKWKERVKLVIGNLQKETPKASNKPGATLQENDFKEELTEAVIRALVDNGEICGTAIIAQHIIKQELCKSNVDFKDKKQALTFLKNLLRSAHDIAKTSGPLMFVELDKTYYNSVSNL